MSYLGYLIGSGFLLWAIIPLFKKDSTWVSLYWEADELEARKKRVYGNIADLEFDYAMGRLSENDFKNVRQSFLSEAGRVIEKIEGEISSDLTKRIIADAANDGKSGSIKKMKHKCPKCKSKNLPEAKFCMKCGREL